MGRPRTGDYSSAEGPLGLHGRISNTPAEIFSVKKEWKNNVYTLSAEGSLREGFFFGRNLELKRRISAHTGENSIFIEDEAVNHGSRPDTVKILYHINIGYPLLSEHTKLIAPEHKILPRDEAALAGINDWSYFREPENNFQEQVFMHNIPPDSSGYAAITVENKKLGLAMQISYSKNTLPNLMEWKMTGTGEYVLGIEPNNCSMEKFQENEEKYILLGPYERKKFRVIISFSEIK